MPRSLLPTALLTAMVMGGCGEHGAELDAAPTLTEFEHKGMPCLLYRQHTYGSPSYSGFTCDWSKYREPGESYSDHEIAHGTARAGINKAFAEIDELRAQIKAQGESDE